MIDPTLSAVAAQIDPAAAQLAVARAMATAGAQAEWDSETIEWVVFDLLTALPEGLPRPNDSSRDALRFWTAVNESK